jgi:hypothetical protein
MKRRIFFSPHSSSVRPAAVCAVISNAVISNKEQNRPPSSRLELPGTRLHRAIQQNIILRVQDISCLAKIAQIVQTKVTETSATMQSVIDQGDSSTLKRFGTAPTP